MSEPTSAWDSVWKWIAMSAVGALAGLLLGQFTPNRNIVTMDQLNAHIKDESQELRDINRKLDGVTDFISEQRGENTEREKLTDSQRRQSPR